MKHIRTILIASLLCLAGLSLQAQDRWIYSAELTAGVGFKQGPLFFVTPQFTAQYPLGGGFTAGAGIGFRIGRPCYEYSVLNGSGSRSFCTELDIPLYLRFGYGKEHLFAHLDAGYAVGVFTRYRGDDLGGSNKKDPRYSGFFFEPQLGWKFGRKSALALGFLLQRSKFFDSWKERDGASIIQGSKSRKQFTPALTLRYSILF